MDTATLGRLRDKLRRESGALFVIAVRSEDAAYSCDPRLAPRDFGETIEREIPNLVEDLAKHRTRRPTTDH